MNREEILTYLENLRNLETLRYFGKSQIQQSNQEILRIQKESTKGYTDRIGGGTIVVMVFFGLLIIAALVSIGHAQELEQGSHTNFILFVFRFWIPISCGVVNLILLVPILANVFEVVSYNKHIRTKNKQIDKNSQKNQQELSKHNEIVALCTNEIQTIEPLLAEAYSFNILPIQYRNLESVVYIYDYLSTSQQTLENALLHSHMEEGIRQITARLNVIILQNMQMIRLLRSNLAQNAIITSQINQLSSDVRMNTYYTKVNQYYVTSRLL